MTAGGGRHSSPLPANRLSDEPPQVPTWTAVGSGDGLSHPDGTAASRALDTLPIRADNEGPTHGYLFDAHDRQIGSSTIRSSRDDTLIEDLDLPRRAALSVSMTSHVEAKVAAMIRRGQAPRSCVLVINNERGPCGWLMRQRGQRRFGTTCDELLADALPVGAVLTVVWRDARGVERSEVYRGTGRRIKG